MRAVPHLNRVVLLFLILSLCGAITVVVQRSAVIDQATAVEVAVDHGAVVALCRQVGYDVDLFWQRAVAAGATSVATRGITVSSLIDNGQMMVMTGADVRDEIRLGNMEDLRYTHVDPDRTYLIVACELAADIEEHLRRLCGEDGYGKIELEHIVLFDLAATIDEAKHLQLTPVADVPDETLSVVYMLSPIPRQLSTAIIDNLRSIGRAESGARIAFSGWTVPGYPQMMSPMGEIIKDQDMQVAVFENHPQTGIDDIAVASNYSLFRARIIAPNDRTGSIALAARERHVRLFLISPTLGARQADQAVDEWISLIERTDREIRQAGFVPGSTEAFPLYRVPVWALFVIGCGISMTVAGVMWLWGIGSRFPVLALITGVSGGLITLSGFMGRELIALAGACIFPVIAVLLALRIARRYGWVIVPSAVCLAVAVSGGLLITGLLGDSAWALKVRQFRGVKLAYCLPLILVLIPWVKTIIQAHGGLAGLLRLQIWRERLTVGACVVALMALGCAAFYVGRSGHDSGLPISSMEILVRGALEQLLAIRPRTKELILGFPALVVACKLYCCRSRWAILFAVIGCIAPISVVNSFSHLHTPVLVTIIRSVMAAVAGTLLGVIAVLGWVRLSGTGGSQNHETPVA